LVNSSNAAQTYSYDGLNRLASASSATSGWAQAYGYDIYGNRWVTSPSPTTVETPTGSAAYLSNNRINGWGYDSAGNLLSIANLAKSFTYDGENRMMSTTLNGVTTTYTILKGALRQKP
jgi:YD repeat-containing protein